MNIGDYWMFYIGIKNKQTTDTYSKITTWLTSLKNMVKFNLA